MDLKEVGERLLNKWEVINQMHTIHYTSPEYNGLQDTYVKMLQEKWFELKQAIIALTGVKQE